MQSITRVVAKQYFPVGMVWLFHISAIIGIYLGFYDWFIEKTPLNLTLCFGLLLLAWPLNSRKHIAIVYSFFVAGMFAEWCGVHFGFPFGNYIYGDNLGFKFSGVPILIGINWAMLVLITGSIASRITKHLWLKVMIGSALMVFLDLFIEPNASALDFWHWENSHIPLSNYVGWFVIAALLHFIFQRTIKEINFRFSLNLYLAQLIFFASLYVYSLV